MANNEEVKTMTLEELQALVPGSIVTSVESFKDTIINLRSLVGDHDNEAYRKLFATIGYDDMTNVDPKELTEKLVEAAKNNEFIKAIGVDTSKSDPIKLAKIIQAAEVKTVVASKSKTIDNVDKFQQTASRVKQTGKLADQIDFAKEFFKKREELKDSKEI